MEQLPLDPIDIALLLILLVGAWRGFVKGLVLSIASLVGLVGGIWAAQHVSHLTAAQLAPHVTWSEQTLGMASLALTFLGVVVAVHLLAKLLERLLDMVALGLANKLGGAAFGVAKMALICSFLLMFVNQLAGPTWMPGDPTSSVLLTPIESIAPAMTPSLTALGEAIGSDSLATPSLEAISAPLVP